MTEIQNRVIGKITAQQGKGENPYLYHMGEQLKDICSREPESAAIVLQDMENASMSLTAMEKKISGEISAKRIKVVTGPEMEKRIRAFYGLPEAPKIPLDSEEEPKKQEPRILSLFDLL